MPYNFSVHNAEILAKHDIDDDFVWGKIEAVHTIGDIQIIEHTHQRDGRLAFHPYVKGEDSHSGSNTLDGAILTALGLKYDGHNSQFALYAERMLGGF